jgi:hypothetical protein
VLYPDAGHGFLFQEGTPFAVTIESFLSGTAAPLSTAAIRSAYLAGQAKINAAGRTWMAELKALSAKTAPLGLGGVTTAAASPSPQRVAGIDEPFAVAMTDLDARLLAADAAGAAGDAIAAFVSAQDKLADDVLALSAIGGTVTWKTWTTTITRDSHAAQRAVGALRQELGLPAAR